MNRTRAMSAALLAALAATAAACPSAAAAVAQQETPATTGPSPTTLPANATPAERAAQEIKSLTDSMNGVSKRLSREDAARRLLQRGGADALRPLRDALDGTSREAKIAVARALQDNPDPPGVFVAPLLAALNDKQFVEPAAGALSSYRRNPAVVDGLIAFAKNAQQPTASRISVARALGEIPEKRVADALATLLDPQEQLGLRNAAADALGTITGRREFGRDTKKWITWIAANANKTPEAWQVEILPERAGAHAQSERQRLALVNRLKAMLDAQYRATPKDQRAAFIVDALNAPEPETRMIAARDLAKAAFPDLVQAGGAQLDAVRDRLADLVGDTSADVRLEAARVLLDFNYTNALDPLLNQLAIERDDNVRVVQIRTLARIQSIRQVPQLRTLLKDPSTPVARAAADALKQLGPTIREKDPNLANQVADDLIQIIRNAPRNDPASQELREAAVGAMVPLRIPEMSTLARQLLVPEETIPVRRQTLLALAELGDPRSQDSIVEWIGLEKEASLRFNAIEALGRTGGLDQSAVIISRMNPTVEPDKDVRDRAREIFKGLLPTARAEQLRQLLGTFRADPDMHSAILISWITKLEAAGQTSDVALQEINLGDDLMKLTKPAEAAPHFRKSLDLLNKQGADVEGVIGKLLDAYLAAKQYDAAAAFGQEMIQQFQLSVQGTVGPKIQNAADRLNNAGKLDDAQALVKAGLKMKPPLAEKYQDELRRIDAEVQQKRAEKER